MCQIKIREMANRKKKGKNVFALLKLAASRQSLRKARKGHARKKNSQMIELQKPARPNDLTTD